VDWDEDEVSRGGNDTRTTGRNESDGEDGEESNGGMQVVSVYERAVICDDGDGGWNRRSLR
jgi:hypothetical protein